jgi:hypothetical protein
VAFVAGGCTSKHKAKATVSGTVSIDGTPLYLGTVTFHSTDNQRIGSAQIEEGGKYKTEEAPIGDVIITVTVPDKASLRMGRMMGKPAAPKDLEMKAPADTPMGKAAAKQSREIDPDKIVLIPERYGEKEKSGLKFTVAKGENTKNIELTEKK